ncbi:hypothetical protein LTR53_010645 [Teratosphaeriaceae sp. CCFEE 6253]|nr:hypothetical protein LTR53_010645 [Teratosphaeriaceae sp. CCFEE 6253]
MKLFASLLLLLGPLAYAAPTSQYHPLNITHVVPRAVEPHHHNVIWKASNGGPAAPGAPPLNTVFSAQVVQDAAKFFAPWNLDAKVAYLYQGMIADLEPAEGEDFGFNMELSDLPLNVHMSYTDPDSPAQDLGRPAAPQGVRIQNMRPKAGSPLDVMLKKYAERKGGKPNAQDESLEQLTKEGEMDKAQIYETKEGKALENPSEVKGDPEDYAAAEKAGPEALAKYLNSYTPPEVDKSGGGDNNVKGGYLTGAKSGAVMDWIDNIRGGSDEHGSDDKGSDHQGSKGQGPEGQAGLKAKGLKTKGAVPRDFSSPWAGSLTLSRPALRAKGAVAREVTV